MAQKHFSVPENLSDTPTPSPSPGKGKPSKKDTVEELRLGLTQLGLDSRGKKETLFRRLFNYVTRSHFARDPQPQPEPEPESSPTTPAALAMEKEAGPKGPLRKFGKQPIKSFLCFDVEATCRGGREFDYPNEIIEFPVVLCRWREKSNSLKKDGGDSSSSSRLEQVATFHSYVRPTWRPILTDFCTSLTGITQEMVDKSPTFPEMLVKLEKWLDKWDLRDEHGGLKDAAWVTDGPWDLRDFVPKQLHITPPFSPSPPYPPYLLAPYLNIKQATQTVLTEEWKREQYALCHPGQPPNARALSRITTSQLVNRQEKSIRERNGGPNFYLTITGQVERLGLGEFQGQQHSGIADATNIARILIALAEKDVLIEANARLPPAKNAKNWPWMGAKPGEMIWEEWMSVPLPSTKPELDPIATKPELGSPAVGAEAVDKGVQTDSAALPSSSVPVVEELVVVERREVVAEERGVVVEGRGVEAESKALGIPKEVVGGTSREEEEEHKVFPRDSA